MINFINLFLLVLISSTLSQEITNSTYESLSAEEKMARLWTKIRENITPAGFYSRFESLGIFFEGMNETFDWISDQFIKHRRKYIHSCGVIGKVEYIAEANAYTGVFQGCKNVLLRLSVAKGPDFSKLTPKEAENNFIPGFGIKFLRDANESGNLVAMYSVNGTPSWNYFKFDFSNHIPDPNGFILKLLAKKFARAQKEVGLIGLRNLAEYTCDGKSILSPKFPFVLVFKPTTEVTKLGSDEHRGIEYPDELKRIPVGMTIYNVYAKEKPDSSLVKIGSIKSVSEFTTSDFGDKQFFFRHNRIKYDWEIYPEFKPKNYHMVDELESYFH